MGYAVGGLVVILGAVIFALMRKSAAAAAARVREAQATVDGDRMEAAVNVAQKAGPTDSKLGAYHRRMRGSK